MRIHPSQLSPRTGRWQLPLASALLFLLIALNLTKDRDERVDAQLNRTAERTLRVVVVRKSLAAGDSFDTARLSFETRSMATLPNDVVTSLEALRGKIAVGPIPAGYALAFALVADRPLDPSKEVVSLSDSESAKTVEKSNQIAVVAPPELPPVELSEGVAVPIHFDSGMPRRGGRIAVIQRDGDDVVAILVEDGNVLSSDAQTAVLQVSADEALLIEDRRGRGAISFVELPRTGVSPYRGRGVNAKKNSAAVEIPPTLPVTSLTAPRPPNALGPLESLPEASALVEPASPPRLLTVPEPAKSASKSKGYVWIAGEGVRYGIDDTGRLTISR